MYVRRIRLRFEQHGIVTSAFGCLTLSLTACSAPQFSPLSSQPPAAAPVTEGKVADAPHAPENWLEPFHEAQWATAVAWGACHKMEVYGDTDAAGDLQLFVSAQGAKGEVLLDHQQLTYDTGQKLDPAVAFAPSVGGFVVLYAAVKDEQHTIHALLVQLDKCQQASVSSNPAAPTNTTVITNPNVSFDSPKAVWVDSRQQVFAVFHSQTAVYGAWLSPQAPGNLTASAAFALIENRTGQVSSPAVAYAASTDRLMVAWGVMRTQENIEVGVMSPADQQLSFPAQQSWTHKRLECSDEMAPGCIEGGDRPALAYNPTLKKFGLAIADDLNDGSRVEAFLLADTCSSAACDIEKAGTDDHPQLPRHERERALVSLERIASVAIAPINDRFIVGFAFGEGLVTGPSHIGLTSFDGMGRAADSPTRVSSFNSTKVVLGSAGAFGRADQEGGQVLFRERLDNDTQIHRQSITVSHSGTALRGQPMRSPR